MMLENILSTFREIWIPGKGRILNLLLKAYLNTDIESNIFGFRINLDLNDYIQKNIFLGTFEPYETNIIKKALRPGMIFVDIGANVGYFSALASREIGPTGHVYAFEPSPYAIQRLNDLVQKNNIQNITVLPMGLGSIETTLNLYIPPDNFHNHTPTLTKNSDGQSTPVAITTLDQFAIKNQIHHIDFIKIDVEGFEMEVLKGSSNLLKNKSIKSILCEFNNYWLEQNSTSSLDLYEFIISKGFQCRSKKEDFLQKPVQNLLFCIE